MLDIGAGAQRHRSDALKKSMPQATAQATKRPASVDTEKSNGIFTNATTSCADALQQQSLIGQ